MKSIRIAIGVSFIVSGILLGAWITLHYFSLGISAIRDGEIARGIVLLLVWSDILGIAAMVSLVFPGVMVLRNWGRTPTVVGELGN
jgi:hypothetical protein